MENNVVEQNKNKNLIIGVLVFIIALLLAVLVFLVFIKKDEPQKQVKSQENTHENDKLQQQDEKNDNTQEDNSSQQQGKTQSNTQINEGDVYKSIDGKRRLRVVTKANGELYRNIYAEAKKIYDAKVSEFGYQHDEYQYDGNYLYFDDGLIIEIKQEQEDDKYAIYEGDDPGNNHQYYVYEIILNKSTKQIVNKSIFNGAGKYEFWCTSFAKLNDKYYFVVPRNEEFSEVYSEDWEKLGAVGGTYREENYVHNNALYYIKYENNSFYLANTSGLKKVLLENVKVDDFYIISWYENNILQMSINSDKEICSFKYNVNENKIYDLKK